MSISLVFELLLGLVGPFILRMLFEDDMQFLLATLIYSILVIFGKYVVVPSFLGPDNED